MGSVRQCLAIINEMGVHTKRKKGPDSYRDTYEEVQRLIRVCEEICFAADTVERTKDTDEPAVGTADEGESLKLTTSKLAKELGCET